MLQLVESIALSPYVYRIRIRVPKILDVSLHPADTGPRRREGARLIIAHLLPCLLRHWWLFLVFYIVLRFHGRCNPRFRRLWLRLIHNHRDAACLRLWPWLFLAFYIVLLFRILVSCVRFPALAAVPEG